MTGHMTVDCTLHVNGLPVTLPVAGPDRLIDLLRGPLGYTGTKEGCGAGECGACTVLVDGQAVNACLYPALEADGKQVTTIEGLLGAEGTLSTLQKAFTDHGGIQCGFCSPGMLMAAAALVQSNPSPNDEEIRDALVGNLCRCTGYVQIVDAIKIAVERIQAAEQKGAGCE